MRRTQLTPQGKGGYITGQSIGAVLRGWLSRLRTRVTRR